MRKLALWITSPHTQGIRTASGELKTAIALLRVDCDNYWRNPISNVSRTDELAWMKPLSDIAIRAIMELALERGRVTYDGDTIIAAMFDDKTAVEMSLMADGLLSFEEVDDG